MTRFLTKEEFLRIILDNKSLEYLKAEDPNNLHYLQLIFFKPWMAKISVVLYLSLTILPLLLIKIFWLKIIVFAILLYFDYKHWKIIKSVLTKDLCLYETFMSGEK